VTTPALRHTARTLLVLATLLCAACATSGARPDTGNDREYEAIDPPAVATEPTTPLDEQPEPVLTDGSAEVPLAVAQSERRDEKPAADGREEIIVQARVREQVIHDLVSEAQALLRDVKLEYAFTGSGKRETLRGRPVAFALWSEAKKQWTVANIEIPRPPVKWKPGKKPLPFTLRTPGLTARHVKGTGAERLMFAFSSDGDPLKVYGRKFPVFDNAAVKRKDWRAVAQTATPIVYLPFTEDTLDPGFVSAGREFLLSTARRAMDELRAAKVASSAFPGTLLADVVPAEVLATLAVIEQTDDADYVTKQDAAFEEVLSQYGLKREEAYRYSVSSAAALGPMQFTNRRGNGTYALVVRRYPEARLDPDFERGATNLLNAMKAAIGLFDIELAQMRPDIRRAYDDNRAVLGIFPVAAYNGGPRNVTKLYRVLQKMRVQLEDLARPGEQTAGPQVSCPCVWKQDATGLRPVSIPKYNNENRWYIEKYQSILGLLE
jgi:hypothetical protein